MEAEGFESREGQRVSWTYVHYAMSLPGLEPNWIAQMRLVSLDHKTKLNLKNFQTNPYLKVCLEKKVLIAGIISAFPLLQNGSKMKTPN